ncbi:MAG: hypothetical protein HKP40_13825 [Litoreibacter sp.]|nr:hypothetical protein [Litoreibacter sp.]
MTRFATPALIALLATAGAASAAVSTVVEGQARAVLNDYAISVTPFSGPSSTVVEGQAQAVTGGIATAASSNIDRVQDILDDYGLNADLSTLNGAQVASILGANNSGENPGIIKSRDAAALR